MWYILEAKIEILANQHCNDNCTTLYVLGHICFEPSHRHYLTPTWWLRLKWQQVGPKTYLCKSFTKFKCFHVKTLIFTILHWSCTSRLCVHDQIWSTSNIYVTLQDFHNIKLFFLNQANKLNQSRAGQSVSQLVGWWHWISLMTMFEWPTLQNNK